MSFTHGELNYLIYRYLQESGFTHAAYAFSIESHLASSDIDGSHVPAAALLHIIEKGLFFTEAEIGFDENGNPKYPEPLTLMEAVTKYLPQNSSKDSSKNDSQSNIEHNTSPKNDVKIEKPSKYTLPPPSRIMTRAARLSMEKKLNEVQNESNPSSSSPLVIRTEAKSPLASISSNVPRSASTSPRKPETLEPDTKPLNNLKPGKTPPRSTENQDVLFKPDPKPSNNPKPGKTPPRAGTNQDNLFASGTKPLNKSKSGKTPPRSAENQDNSFKPDSKSLIRPKSGKTPPRSTDNQDYLFKPDAKPLNKPKSGKTPPRSEANQDHSFKPDSKSLIRPKSGKTPPRAGVNQDKLLASGSKPLNNPKSGKTTPRSTAHQDYLFKLASSSPSAPKPIILSAPKPIASSAPKPIASSASKPMASSASKPMASSAPKPMPSSAPKIIVSSVSLPTPYLLSNPVKSRAPDLGPLNNRTSVITFSRSVPNRDELSRPVSNPTSAPKPMQSSSSSSGLTIKMSPIGLDRVEIIKVNERKCSENENKKMKFD